MATHGELWEALASLGEDLKFVFITSHMNIVAGETMAVKVAASEAVKCDRCWHWRDDVGHDLAHPTICGRCTTNLFGAGEDRKFA
jgi:isoleucyl-tRNA synthetase